MPLYNARLLHKKNWGLPDEYISQIIKSEKMQEVTNQFSSEIRELCGKFGNLSNIRMAAFNEQSGEDSHSECIFKSLISLEREVMYVGDMSNKECCVLLLNNPKGVIAVKKSPLILAHEYAHHFQFAHAGFPFYFSRSETEITGAPAFAISCEMGTTTKAAFIDGVELPERYVVIADSLERISDIICEGILREKKIPSSLEKLYIEDLARPEEFNRYPKEIVNRYVKRLLLRDYAEWAAVLKLSISNNAEDYMKKGRERGHRLNKNHLNACKAFDAIHTLCLETDFNLFRDPTPTKSYMEKIFSILKIVLKPSVS